MDFVGKFELGTIVGLLLKTKPLSYITPQGRGSHTTNTKSTGINLTHMKLNVNEYFLSGLRNSRTCSKNTNRNIRISKWRKNMLERYPTIKDFAFLPNKALDSFRAITKNTSSNMYEIMHIIDTEYLSAMSEEQAQRVIYKKGTSIAENITDADKVYIISTFDAATDGSKVIFLFERNKRQGMQPWELQSAISENEYSDENYLHLGENSKEMLRNFAYWSAFHNDLKTLKNDLALNENWSYVENPDDDDFPILKSYFTYTFSKLWRNKQITVGIDRRYAVFNTGLVNRNYQYIYALFEKNVGASPWRFKMFCIPGIQQGGRILGENFRALPKPARYFSDITDISYIITTDKSPDEQLPDLQPDHYFVDHPDRLPLHFLLDGCRKSKEIIDKITIDTSEFTHAESKTHWQEIGEMIGENAEVYDDLETSFRSAVRKAVMRVSWNYRTAIPIYFPTNDKMSILLPLTFSTDSSADVALVVERNPISQKYSAPTILKLPMAYANARLVCKPESDWLNQRVFELDKSKDSGEDDDYI